MKDKKRHRSYSQLQQAVLIPSALLSLGLSAPVMAQSGQNVVLEEIIVSARRQEESVQEIPISITVVDQETMANNNVFSSVDLKQFTPSLAVNTRFGPDQASFAIRGFTQELRTTASVGFYFAEVVAPRGGGSVTAGDGAGPGAFFDLQNVLVLKGPQGTLFGRNTTGGAILLTPQEPTNQLEGYIEGSAGDYDMRRVQGVVNIPFSDNVRARFGVDTMQRDGYLKNISGVGPKDLADTDYISARASVIWEITDAVENYTILSYTDSENNGFVTKLIACGPSGAWYNPGGQCNAQLASQGGDFYKVASLTKNPSSELKQWQVINKTSWSINDDLTFKNILSYADLLQTNRTSVYGIAYTYPGGGRYGFTESNQIPGGIPTNSQVSFVEEMQLQGYAMDGDLTWQAGLYFENSRPDGVSGSQSVNQLYCATYDPLNPGSALCASIGGTLGRLGGISRQAGTIEYTTQAAYTEMTFDITDQWKVTGGLRYTRDEVEAKVKDARIWTDFPIIPNAPGVVGSGPSLLPGYRCVYNSITNPGINDCRDELDQSSEAVTGLIDFDYFATEDVMLYAKYSRGYRMGAINLFGGNPYRVFEPETVDAFEVGAKTKFGGPVPGTLNIAAFYNELSDQQLQVGYVFLNGNTPTTGIDNAGKSVIQGVEVESSFMLLEDLNLTLSYTYLDTELKEATPPGVPAFGPLAGFLPPGTRMSPAGNAILSSSSVEGEHLSFSPRHSVVVGLNYRLPLSAEIGDVSVGAVYSYTAEQLSTAPNTSPYAWLPSYEIVNFNANWRSIMGSNFDAGLFVTNAFDEEYINYVPGNYYSVGIEMGAVGVPRMWGGKVRYNF
jgi:iron complex outermembrane receptor protein